MRTYTQTVREGEDMGPVDWSHPTAKDMPPIWREAEQNPDGFLLCENGSFTARAIFKICMYDGWPYWKPTPAIYHSSPLGGGEWAFFNSYGINAHSIVRKRDTDGSPKGPDRDGLDGEAATAGA